MPGNMKKKFSISLKNRLTLTYAFFISLTIGILILLINIFVTMVFDNFIRENISSRSGEIVSIIAEQYNQGRRSFDINSIRAIAMYFSQQGYLLTLEDEFGNLIWDSPSLPMMSMGPHHGNTRGGSRRGGMWGVNPNVNLFPEIYREQYPVNVGNTRVGTLRIETLAPFFYSDTESRFLISLNQILFSAWIILTLLSIAVSFFLSRSIAQPIQKAKEAAKLIAETYNSNTLQFNSKEGVRINESYKTKEIAELSSSINILAQELEEGERRQRQLTSDIAHELRTPLATLQGSMEAMMDGVYRADREHLESCHEEILRLTRLVEDMNILTGFEWKNSSLNKTEFDLAKLLLQIKEQWKVYAREKGLELNLNLDGKNTEHTIFADYDRIKQVFINLLSNSIKYTDSGHITIEIKLFNDIWQVSIIDSGIGIPKEELGRIFERFYRSDKSRSRSTGGAGIGLSIAAAIISAHGGNISAENNSDGGSIFRVSLPKSIT